MGVQKFEASKREGRHRELAQFVGEWTGTSRVWFEPGKLGDEAPIRGAIRPILDGRFLLHEYDSMCMGAPQQGLAIIGRCLDRDRYEMAWIDSFHNGTAIMFCEGEHGALPVSVLGHYGGHDGSDPWGWRTTFELESADHLVITAWNITPQGEEAKAVEIDYRRKR